MNSVLKAHGIGRLMFVLNVMRADSINPNLFSLPKRVIATTTDPCLRTTMKIATMTIVTLSPRFRWPGEQGPSLLFPHPLQND